MKSTSVCSAAKEIAASKNLYVRGASGQKLTQANKLRFTGIDAFNTKRSKIIFDAAEDTVAYDEYGFFSKATGYNCRNLGEIMNLCEDINKDFNNVLPGEIVFMKDRVGIYVGDNQVIACNNLGVGYTILDGWVSHGKLPEVEYDCIEPVKEVIEYDEREVDGDISAEEIVENVEEELKQSKVEARRDTFRRRH